MKALHIAKGYWIDTADGHQEIQSATSSETFIANNYDENGKFTFLSTLTRFDILAAERDYSGKAYDMVVFDQEGDE